MLDLDAQEDDVSGAAQDRTAEFAAQSSSAPCGGTERTGTIE
jgi:hypothetical protein